MDENHATSDVSHQPGFNHVGVNEDSQSAQGLLA
jgi:hypothetical protein